MLSELRNSAIAATIIGVALIIILLEVLLSVLMRPRNLMGKGANALPPLRRQGRARVGTRAACNG